MSETQVHPLPKRALRICLRCRMPVHVFKTPEGTTIALDAVHGGWLTTADGTTAYKSDDDNIGYRDHSLSCDRVARAPLSGVVSNSEFLWG